MRLGSAGAAGREHDHRHLVGGDARNVEAGAGGRRPGRDDHRRQPGGQLVVIREAARVGMAREDLADDAGGPARRQQVRLPGDERGDEAEHEVQAVLAQVEHVAPAREPFGELVHRRAEARRGHRRAAVPADRISGFVLLQRGTGRGGATHRFREGAAPGERGSTL